MEKASRLGPREITEIMPLSFERETVRAVIMNTNGEILLLQKDGTSKTKYKWELPGGEVDASTIPATPEQLFAETLREVNEETGLDLSDPENTNGSLGYFDYVRKHKQVKSPTRVHAYYFLLNPEQSNQNIVIDPTDKHKAYKWVSSDELRKMQEKKQISSNTSRVTKFLLRKTS